MRRRQVYAARAAEEQSKAAILSPAVTDAPESQKTEKKRGRPAGSKNKNRR